ncbi:MAG: hypothetical protein IIB99_00950 [Planctomycetes bacterium]|nr:hypothetical protein [Planctomycetota bacterium]
MKPAHQANGADHKQTVSHRDALAVRRAVRLIAPRSPKQLHAYIRIVLGFDIPRRPIVTGHSAPFAYLEHAYFEDRQPRDCVVWANRGGGKTQLGAIATLLDMLFKPGIEIRILGGSFDQSSKMYRYLRRLLESDLFGDLIDGKFTGHAVQLRNGSRVEVLAQSQTAVRGQRVHKVRCDEVELFEVDIWEAAQLVTRSGQCGEVYVPASIEALSTMHRPFGLMQRLVRDSSATNRRVFRWSVLDVLRRCEPQRSCAACPLWQDCQGEAKRARGFIEIDDAIQQLGRVGAETWQSEMLCRRPSRSDSVYPEFAPKVHVSDFDIAPIVTAANRRDRYTWIGGIDFGYRSPTVLLWAFVDDRDVLHIVDELVVREHTTEQIIAQAKQRAWPKPDWIGADPAGHQRNEHTGTSTITLWRRAGYAVRARCVGIETGVKAVRRRLQRADGAVGLRIHSRCNTLIEALTMYHYPPDKPEAETPVKDGHDHAADALRYMIINLDRGDWNVTVRTY